MHEGNACALPRRMIRRTPPGSPPSFTTFQISKAPRARSDAPCALALRFSSGKGSRTGSTTQDALEPIRETYSAGLADFLRQVDTLRRAYSGRPVS